MLLAFVGKPNVGKSTFFKAITTLDIAIANYPFTTIKSNHGVGYVKINCPDKEFNLNCNPSHGFCVNHNRFVPIEIMDLAGLVPGASEGKGLGNQFLDDLRQADAFVHIVDISGTTDSEGKSTENHDPLEDIKFLEEELDKWFLNILLKAWKIFVKKIETEPKENFSKTIAKQFSGLKVTEENVKDVIRKENLPEKISLWDNDVLMRFASSLRKESKPTVIIANKIDKEKSKENYQKLKLEFPNSVIIPCSADSELALREAQKAGLIEYIPGEKGFKITGNLNEKQKLALDKIKKEILDKFENGTGVQEVLNYVVLDLLKYIAIYPIRSVNKLIDGKGNILPDCFLMPQGSTSLDLAFLLHTDFGNNFIKAIDARTKKVLGKDYVLKHQDVIEIVTK
ncbi:redox-regulated ATPase YchF [Patescibacteria group bacterium]|nr:redox-regulated ATPase YchF [Patescibacteria group bacterium]